MFVHGIVGNNQEKRMERGGGIPCAPFLGCFFSVYQSSVGMRTRLPWALRR